MKDIVAEWACGIKGRRDSVLRGGHFWIGAGHCRPASRTELQPEARDRHDGLPYGPAPGGAAGVRR